jgi:predicted permease
MTQLWNDVRFALRTLRKSPVFTIVAILSLALGIGANTAIFTLLDQVLLRLLPVEDPQQLVALKMDGFHYGGNWGMNALSYPMYHDFSQHNSVFSGMFCRFQYDMSVTFQGNTERVRGELVSGTYFPVLGVGAVAGRTFTPDDDRVPDGHPVIVLSYAYWKTRFAGNPAVVGKSMIVNGHSYTVVGVAQRGFDGMEFGFPSKVFVPVMMKAEITPAWADNTLINRRQRWVNAFGRLKSGVTPRQAEASLQPFFHSMLEMEVREPAFRNAEASVRARFLKNIIRVLPGSQGHSWVRGQLVTPLWVLMALTGGVLLIACANVASLLVAKATARHKEIAIRLAMGASRGQIIRQLLVESLLLSLAGGVAGLLLALWADRVLMALLPPETLTLKISAIPDFRLLGFTLVVSILTGVVFGLIPALRCTNPDVAPTLKDQAGAVVGGGGQVRLRKALVAAQVMLSLLLLTGAGLFIRSLQNLRDLGPGFPTENLLAFEIDPPLAGYDTAKTKAFYQRLTDEVSAIPGVRLCSLASLRILEDNEWDNWVTIEGFTPKPGEYPDPFMNSISPGYFATLGVPIVAGRDFTTKDTAMVQHGEKPDDKSPTVVIVNEKFAQKFFGSANNAIGRRCGFGIDPGTKTDMEIVGVIANIKYTNLRDQIPIQMFEPYLASNWASGMTVYARTTMSSDEFFPAVRRKVRDLDANLPLYGMRSMDEQLSNSLLIDRLIASLSTVFGFLATLLAAIGLYGVMAYTVERRTREIGVRMALGAYRKDVIWLVMREVLLLVAIGVTTGLIAAVALTRFVQSQLFGLSPHDPLTLILAALGLSAVACAAGYIPAMRASRVDAMQALRYE